MREKLRLVAKWIIVQIGAVALGIISSYLYDWLRNERIDWSIPLWNYIRYPIEMPTWVWILAFIIAVSFTRLDQILIKPPSITQGSKWYEQLHTRWLFPAGFYCGFCLIGFILARTVLFPSESCPPVLYLSPVAAGPGDPAGDTNTWNIIAEDLQAEIRKNYDYRNVSVRLTQIETTSTQIKELRSGRIHIAAVGAGTAATAALDARCRFFPGMVLCDKNRQPLDYTATFIANKGYSSNSKCYSVTDLFNQAKEGFVEVAVGDKPSLSSFMIPRLALDRYDLRPFQSRLSQWDLVKAVADRTLVNQSGKPVFSACVASDVLDRNWREIQDKITVLTNWPPDAPPAWTSHFPSFVVGWRADLPVKVQLSIAHTLDHFVWPKPTEEIPREVRPGGFCEVQDFLQIWQGPIDVADQYKRRFNDQ